MPDDDRIPRSLSGRWHRALKAFLARESQEDIEFHVARATADTLRRTGGVPELAALGAQIYEAASEPDNDPPLFRAASRHIPTRLARQAADVLVAVMKDRLALTSPDSAALILARRIVADISYSFGLDRMIPILITSGYKHADLSQQFANIAESTPLTELAKRLLAHPDGNKLRAPAQRRVKVATADLMNLDIEEIP